MLFNSFSFLFIFLPLALAGYYLLLSRGRDNWAFAFLGGGSIVFYGLWDWHFVPLLLGSIVFNYAVGRALSIHPEPGRRDGIILALGVATDLALLAYYKYAGFFVANANEWLHAALPVPEIVLPLGISFFTFTQIAYLVDAYRKEVLDFNFLRYLLFVTFFPHLIAGPVLHHAEVMPQFRAYRGRNWAELFAVGFTLFFFGLFKKTVLADSLAEFASPVFAAVQAGQMVGFKAAWGGALAYTLQLYFDFSAYSDMAIGLALLFGVRFPANFNSPYQANSIIDFWRRWHMTLSRFLRDYLYIPLGGGRRGAWRRYRNLMATMFFGGLWHGAGWTFMAWGVLHGVYLTINHLWRDAWGRLVGKPVLPSWAAAFLGRALTFIAVVVAWVFFRADSLHSAWVILQGMAGMAGTQGGDLFQGSSQVRWLLAGLLIVFAAPNALQVLGRFKPALETYPGEIGRPGRGALCWAPTARWAWLTVAAATAGLLNLTRVSEFLYFQF